MEIYKIMPIMEITLVQSFKQQEIINRWNYLASGNPAAVSFSFALVSAFGAIEDGGSYPAGEIIQLIRALQDNGVAFESVSARDVYSVTDFYETPFVPPLNGLQVTNSVGPLGAFGFRTNRTRLDIRRGFKRFTGVPTGSLTNDGDITATELAKMVTLAAKMTAGLSYDDEGNNLTFTPIVVSREKYEVEGSDPVRYAYRYYESGESEQLQHIAQSVIWEPYDNLRGQSSRQIGRGR